MANIILLLLLIILVYSARKNKIHGIMCYYIIRMIIPSTARVYSFSFNTLSLLLLFIIFLPHIVQIYRQRDICTDKYIKSVTFIFISLFILTLLGTNIPLPFQWSSLLQLFMTEIIPSVLLILYLKHQKDYKTFCKVICLCAIFTAVYGIYTYVASDNPIFMMFNTSENEAKDLAEYLTDRGGLTGIAVGIYDDKIALSLISLLLFMFLMNKIYISKPLFIIAIVTTFIDLYLTTQRTGLFCILLFIAIMLLDKRNNIVKKTAIPVFIIFIIFLSFSNNKVLLDSIYSILYIFDDSMQQKLNVGGSSSDMRMLQLGNCIDYLGIENIFQGEGFNFPSYYYTYIFKSSLYGLDMRFMGFESIILNIIMSSGLLGLVIWGIGYFKIFKALYPKNDSLYNFAFYISYIIAIIMTDTSASFYQFFFLAVLNSKSSIFNYNNKKYALINNNTCL